MDDFGDAPILGTLHAKLLNHEKNIKSGAASFQRNTSMCWQIVLIISRRAENMEKEDVW